MDVESYDLLVLKTKQSLDTKVCRKAILASHLCTVLEECNRCVSLSLDLVVKILDGTNIQFHKLCSYLEDAVTLIQMLSDFIKYVIESTAMGCCNMKPFPVTTGNIIFTVFLHCKDSENIYGEHLKSVESQLKDLFRSCHELQLTYLMTMEKHFIFDLTEKDQQEILIEALEINMKIGEIVQTLDIKTMAEQWKAFTVICEKYSNFLLDKNVYNKCTHLFTSIIKHNIKTALESEQDNKTIIRSLKVANFTIKLLLKLSDVFKHATTNNYENIAELLLYIYMRNQAYLECFLDKSKQFTSIVHLNILIPTDSLLNILLQDERFLDCIYKIDVRKLERNTFLGYIILLTSLMKTTFQWKEDQVLLTSKQKIIDCVYRILPLGHYWFNNGLQFTIKDNSGLERCFGLYEYLLAHTVAFASTFNSDLYAELEKYMYEAILSTDCYSAMFSSNLWVIIARMSIGKLAINTLLSLINIYQRLKNHQLFPHSPQNVHLHYAIQKFFEILPAEEMKQIYRENNVEGALKVCHLPKHLEKSAEAVAVENLKTNFGEFFYSSEGNERDFAKFVSSQIETIKIAETCSFKENIAEIEKCVVKMWSKACNGNMWIKMDMYITSGTVWYFQYLEALVALTECIQYKFSSSYSVGKILHVMSTIMDSCTTEVIILIFDLFCTLSLNRREDENTDAIEKKFKRSLNLLLQSVEFDIRVLLLNKLSKHVNLELFRELTSTILYEDAFLRNEWEVYCDNDYKYSTEWKNHLMQAENYEFSHKCLRTDVCPESEPSMKTSKSNFDLGDFIFESSSSDSEEPSRKKAKFDLNETESLIEKLENDAVLLCQINTTLSTDYKKRISDVINKLKNIIS